MERAQATVDSAIHDYLTGLGGLVTERADELGFAAGVLDFGSRYSGAMMWAPQTPKRGGIPRIALGIGWKREDTYPSDENRAPYVGVRTGPRSSEDREAFLSSDAPTTRMVRNDHGYESHSIWPLYRYVPHDGYWWADLDVFRERLTTELDVVIDLFADVSPQRRRHWPVRSTDSRLPRHSVQARVGRGWLSARAVWLPLPGQPAQDCLRPAAVGLDR